MRDFNPADSLPIDFARGLLDPRASRRTALKLGGGSLLALALAACGVPGTPATSTGTDTATDGKDFWASQKQTHALDIASGALYIDVNPDDPSDHPSLTMFEKETGIKVNYDEIIQDTAGFFGKLQPTLAAGEWTGFDMMKFASAGFLGKLIALNYLIPLDQSRMTNFYKYASDLVKNPSFDPGNKYTMAWQSGMTGIAYDPAKVGHKITSWDDMKDPALKGKIGMIADIEDLPNCALCAIDVNPTTSTEDDWKKAAKWLEEQRPLVRQYYAADYIGALTKGDVWASMAWSGDVFQANASGANLEFVVPERGGAILWTDSMMLLKNAKNPLDAMIYMDWVYQPKIAAMLTETIKYISPVPDGRSVIETDAAAATGERRKSLDALLGSPLVFLDPEVGKRLHRYRARTPDEDKVWNALFEPIYQS